MSTRRLAAIGALLLGFGALGLAVVVAVQEFPRGPIALACVAVAAAAIWYGILRRGAARIVGLAIGALGLGAAVVMLVSDRLLEALLVVAALVLSSACGRAAFGFRAHLPQVPPPQRPVLFFNPKSGGGKAERFAVDAEARVRGIEPIELGPPGTSRRSCARRSRAEPTGSRWPAATARRRSSRRSQPSRSALRVRAGGHAQPLRARPRRRSR